MHISKREIGMGCQIPAFTTKPVSPLVEHYSNQALCGGQIFGKWGPRNTKNGQTEKKKR